MSAHLSGALPPPARLKLGDWVCSVAASYLLRHSYEFTAGSRLPQAPRR